MTLRGDADETFPRGGHEGSEQQASASYLEQSTGRRRRKFRPEGTEGGGANSKKTKKMDSDDDEEADGESYRPLGGPRLGEIYTGPLCKRFFQPELLVLAVVKEV